MKKITTFTALGLKGYRGIAAIMTVPGADAEVIIVAANQKELAKYVAYIPPNTTKLVASLCRHVTVMRTEQ